MKNKTRKGKDPLLPHDDCDADNQCKSIREENHDVFVQFSLVTLFIP